MANIRDMKSSLWSSSFVPGVAVVVVLALLLVLAVFQYRWIGRLSDTEEERLGAGVTLAAHRFAQDFDTAVTRAMLVMLKEGRGYLPGQTAAEVERGLARGFEEWRATSPYAELFSGFVWAAVGAADEEGVGAFAKRYRAGDSDFEELPHSSFEPSRGERGVWKYRHEYDATLNAVRAEVLVRPPSQGLAESGRDWRRTWDRRILALEFDAAALASTVMRRLGLVHFGSGGDPGVEPLFDFGVISTETEEWIYRSSDRLSDESPAEADARVPMLRVVSREENPTMWSDYFSPSSSSVPARASSLLLDAKGEAAESSWRLVVRHSAGSLAKAVERQRVRNLAVSAITLALLAGVFVSLLVIGRRAQRLAAERVQFVAGVSHELRTPLTAIRTLSENLRDGFVQSTEQAQQYGEQLSRQVSRLSTLVEHTLNWSRPTRSAPSTIDVVEVVERAIDDCRELIEQRDATVTRQLGDAPIAWVADRRALVMALRNLISNAVKYGGEEPTIVVEARVEDGDGSLEISVTDRGIGVPRGEKARLFEPFYRGAEVRDRQIQGSGLGLGLVQQVAEACGGRVDVRTEPGEGSRFAIVLPNLSESRR